MSISSIRIRPMRREDLDDVVSVHQQAFSGFFLTRMGPAFLRAYYRCVLDYVGSIALISLDEREKGTVNGFAVGFRDPNEFYAMFSARRIRLLPSIAMAAMRDHRLIMQILNNTRRVSERQKKSRPGVVELSSIAVAAQGLGTGGMLVECFVEAARTIGATQILLTTDRDGNAAVRDFYERRSFQLTGVEDRGGRPLCRYLRTLG